MAQPRTKTRQRPPSGTPWEPSDLQAVGFFAAMTALFFLKILLGSAYLWEDFVYQWYPFRQYAATALASGEFPLWNPYTVGGMPFFAEIQTEVLYLPMLALTLFVKNGHLNVYWLELVNVLHYFLAAIGMYLLARSFQLRRMSALLAGTAFAFSGFLVTHAIHQVIIGVAAWYPLLLFMVRKALQEKRWTWVFIGALTLGHSFFAGSPQMSLFFHFFLAVYVAVEIIATVGIRGLATRPGLVLAGRAATLVALSFALVMVQFLPTQDLSALSQRATITYEKGSEGSLGLGQILTLLVPKFFGASDAHNYTWWGPGAYWQYWETSIYFGVAPLLLALFSLRFFRTNRHIAFFASFAIFALLFSLGKNFPLHGLFFDHVPGFASFRNPGRMGVFVAFAGSLLAAFGLDALLKGQPAGNEAKRWLATLLWFGGTCLAIIVAALLGLFDGLFPFLAQQEPRMFVRKELVIALVIVIPSLLLFYALIRRSMPAGVLGFALVAITFADLYHVGAEQNTAAQNPEEHFAQASRLVQFIKSQDELFRVNTRNAQGMIMDRNQGLMDRVYTMEGYTPLMPARLFPPAATADIFYDLLNIKYFLQTDSIRGTIGLKERPGYLQRAYLVFNTSVARNEEEVRAQLTSPAFDPRKMAIVEDSTYTPITATAPDAPWQVRITGHSINRIGLTVETSREGFLVLSEAYFPGWHATIDGAAVPVYRTNFVSRGMPIPAGTHTVAMVFDPPAFSRGALISVLTLLACCGGIAAGVWNDRRGRQQTATTGS
jgi:hypothetical protein